MEERSRGGKGVLNREVEEINNGKRGWDFHRPYSFAHYKER